MATKVKGFKNGSFSELREEVAEFLKENPNIKIVGLNSYYEIKLLGGTSYTGNHCMILIYEGDYEDEEDE